MQGGGTASARVFQAVSDSDDDTDNAWEGRLGDQYKPPGIAKKSRVVFLNVDNSKKPKSIKAGLRI